MQAWEMNKLGRQTNERSREWNESCCKSDICFVQCVFLTHRLRCRGCTLLTLCWAPHTTISSRGLSHHSQILPCCCRSQHHICGACRRINLFPVSDPPTKAQLSFQKVFYALPVCNDTDSFQRKWESIGGKESSSENLVLRPSWKMSL